MKDMNRTPEQLQEEVIRLRKRLAELEALEATMERARAYGAIARDALAIFPESAHKSAMEEVIAFSVNRGH